MQLLLALPLLSALVAATPFPATGVTPGSGLTFSLEPKVVRSLHSLHELKAIAHGKFNLLEVHRNS